MLPLQPALRCGFAACVGAFVSRCLRCRLPPQVSAAAAYVQTGAFAPARTLLLCLAATAIIAWLNLRWGRLLVVHLWVRAGGGAAQR